MRTFANFDERMDGKTERRTDEWWDMVIPMSPATNALLQDQAYGVYSPF